MAPILSDIYVTIYSLMVSLAYLIIIGDLMPDVGKHWGGGLPTSREVWILIGFAFAAPMSFPHNIDYLKYTSAIAVIFMCYIAVLAFVYALPGSKTGLDPCTDQNL